MRVGEKAKVLLKDGTVMQGKVFFVAHEWSKAHQIAFDAGGILYVGKKNLAPMRCAARFRGAIVTIGENA